MTKVNLIEGVKKLPKVKEFSLTSITSSILYFKDEPVEPLNITLGIFSKDDKEVRILIQSPAEIILKKENNFSKLKTQKVDEKVIYLNYNPKIAFFDYEETFTWVENENLFTISVKIEKDNEKLVSEILKTKERIEPKEEKFIKPLPEIEGCDLVFNSASKISPTTISRVGSYYKEEKEILAYSYEGEDSKRIYQELMEKIKEKKEIKGKIEGLIDAKFHIISFNKSKNILNYTSVSKKDKESMEKIINTLS